MSLHLWPPLDGTHEQKWGETYNQQEKLRETHILQSTHRSYCLEMICLTLLSGLNCVLNVSGI